MKTTISFMLLFLFCADLTFAQADWKLTKEEDGINVYVRKRANTKLKEIRIETILKTNLHSIMAAFQDIDNHKNWVFRTPESRLVRALSDSTLLYYVKLDFPFPTLDRDMVIHYTWNQDPITKIITTKSRGVKGEIPEIEDQIRVTEFGTFYKLIPLENGTVKLEYEAWMDPEGTIPPWIVNLAVSSGPTKSMKALKEMLYSGKYDNVRLAGIVEL